LSRVFVFGNASLDLIQYVARLPRPGETLLSDSLVRCPGGKGFNQAIAAARTGARTRLAAPIGSDATAVDIRRFAAQEPGLEAAWIETDAGTDLSIILVDPVGENVVVSSAAAAQGLRPEQATTALAEVAADDIVLVQGNCAADTTLAALDLATARRARGILNTAPVSDACRRGVGRAAVLIANQGEAEALSARTGIEAAQALRSADTQWVIVTRGREPVIVAGPNGVSLFAVPPVEPVDTAGAGDVFCGTLAGMLAKGAEMPEAVAIAISAAGLSVTRRGTTPSFPTGEEVHKLETTFSEGRLQ
jgi:ribokinase